MKIKVERTGGFTGIPVSKEVDITDLPTKVISIARKLLSNQEVSGLQHTRIPKGSADHFNYRISIDDGQNRKVVECTEYDIKDDLKSLITYVEKNAIRKKGDKQ